MFSPYYAAARRRSLPDPLNHSAFNIVLSGRQRRWSMTERPRRDVRVSDRMLSIGPSSLRWDGSAYQFELAERCCPLPRALRGTVRVTPQLQPGVAYPLDRAAHHLWAPLAPRARVEVELHEPAMRWSGAAYLDSNRGDRALEQDFSGWQWSRAATAGGTTVFYETQHRHDAPWPLALEFSERHAAPRAIELPPRVDLANSLWGIRGHARSAAPSGTQLLGRMVDAPFYARSLLRTQLAGQQVATVHESLDLDRFRRRGVQWLLPFRMPRLGAGGTGH